MSTTQTPENPERIVLFIDDNYGAYVDLSAIFTNCGVEIETHVLQNIEEAVDIAKEYAAKGRKIDLICCDTAIGGGLMGGPLNTYHNPSTLAELLTFLKDQPDDLRPAKIYMHSGGNEFNRSAINSYSELKEAGAETMNKTEFIAISQWGQFYTENGGYISDDEPTKLREYTNKEWGTNFPTSRTEIKILTAGEEGKIDRHEAIDAIQAGLLTPVDALMRTELETPLVENPSQHLDVPRDKNFEHDKGDKFDNASPGIAVGRVAFNMEDITALKKQDAQEPIILVLDSFHPGQAHLLQYVNGIILLGEGTEHLKILTDNHNIPAVMGQGRWGDLSIENGKLVSSFSRYRDESEREIKYTLGRGDYISMEAWVSIEHDVRDYDLGKTIDQYNYRGAIYAAKLPILGEQTLNVGAFAHWSNCILESTPSLLQVQANVDSAAQLTEAIRVNVSGAGLLRTEHTTLMNPAALEALQATMKAKNTAEKIPALKNFVKVHKADMAEIFTAASKAPKPFPITVRLLDAPLDEFLNVEDKAIVKERVGTANTRGVQFGLAADGLYPSQISAILSAARDTAYKEPLRIMVPNVRTADELQTVRAMIENQNATIGFKGKIEFGSMIETLDAVSNAGEISRVCDFASFGTNDLTADVMGGIRRNDVLAVQQWMLNNKHAGQSPFTVLCKQVKEKMAEAITALKAGNPNITIGACGQQMEHPDSLKAAQDLKLDSLSMPTRSVAFFCESIARKYLEENQAGKLVRGINTKLQKVLKDPEWLNQNQHILGEMLSEITAQPWLIASTLLPTLLYMDKPESIPQETLDKIQCALQTSPTSLRMFQEEYALQWRHITPNHHCLLISEQDQGKLKQLILAVELFTEIELSPLTQISEEEFLELFATIVECCRRETAFSDSQRPGTPITDPAFLVIPLKMMEDFDEKNGTSIRAQAEREVLGHFNPDTQDKFLDDRPAPIASFIPTLIAAGLSDCIPKNQQNIGGGQGCDDTPIPPGARSYHSTKNKPRLGSDLLWGIYLTNRGNGRELL